MRKGFTDTKIIMIIIAILLGLLACVSLSLLNRSLGIVGRGNSITYTVRIDAKPGEKPSSVTIYLPFPRANDDLLPGLYREFIKETEQSAKYEGSIIEPVNTRYGKMLKIMIPESVFARKSQIYSPGFHVDEKYGYGGLLPIGNSFEDEKLQPIMSIDNQNKVKVIDETTRAIRKELPMYIDYENASGFLLSLKYSISIKDNYVPTYPGENGRVWIVGNTLKTNDIGDLVTGEDNRLEITEKGWVRVPIWIIYDAKETTP
jgi:hypothetical protein